MQELQALPIINLLKLNIRYWPIVVNDSDVYWSKYRRSGGGIKTTTFIALMAATRSTLRGQKDAIISNRLISDKVILKAVGITVDLCFLFF